MSGMMMLSVFSWKPRNVREDVLAGLTTSFALVPEVVAFAFVAGVSPIVGLYSAFFLALIAVVVGGRPGMISGAAGATAIVSAGLVATHGIAYLFPTVVLWGVIELVVGALRWGKFIRMVPQSVMLGFVNGLAIVIAMAQLGSFKTVNAEGVLVFLRGPALGVTVVLVGVTMGVIALLPRVTKKVPAALAAIVVVTGLSLVVNRAWPGLAGEEQAHPVMTIRDMLATNLKAKAVGEARAAAGVTAGATASQLSRASAVGYDTNAGETTTSPHMGAGANAMDRPSSAGVGDASVSVPSGADAGPAAAGGVVVGTQNGDGLQRRSAGEIMREVERGFTGISAGLPRLALSAFPVVDWGLLRVILPYAVVLAGVGLVESLLTLQLVDELTQTRGSANRECVGQGVANIVCGMFGGMGGCAMIGQSLINVNSGGRGRTSGITTAVAVLSFVLFLSKWVEMIPMAALVGVMLMVVIATFEWATFRLWRKVPASDFAVMALVASYTVIKHDLATAVLLGVVASALVFAWQHAKNIGADVKVADDGSEKIYQLHGPLFFASVSRFKELFEPGADPDGVVIDFYYTRVYDQSGLEAIQWLADRYRSAGKRLRLRHLSAECRALLERAGDLVEVDVVADPQYHVASDRNLVSASEKV